MNTKLAIQYFFICLFVLSSIKAQEVDTLKTTKKKKHHFTIFGHHKEENNIKRLSPQKKDTIYVSAYKKHKRKVKYHKHHYNHLKKYESGLYEISIEDENLHEVFDDISKTLNIDFTLVGNTDVLVNETLESFDLEFLIDEICYRNGLIATKEHQRFIIYGTNANTILKDSKVLYKYHPRNVSSDDLLEKIQQLELDTELIHQKAQNLLLLSGDLKSVKQTIALLRSFDIAPKKVSIELLIVEYNHGKNYSWGFDVENAKMQRLSNVSYNPESLLQFGYNFLSDLKPSFKVNLRALSANGYANVVTNPHVMALNNEESVIDLQEKRFIPLQTSSVNGLSTDLRELDAGTILRVTPTILNNGIMQLAIDIENSLFLPQEKGGTIATKENKLRTKTVLKNGETIILGGLIEATESEGRKGVPVLKDIPILGLPFKGKSKQVNYVETVIYITPYIHPLKNDQTIHSYKNYHKTKEKLKKVGKKLEKRGLRKTF